MQNGSGHHDACSEENGRATSKAISEVWREGICGKGANVLEDGQFRKNIDEENIIEHAWIALKRPNYDDNIIFRPYHIGGNG